MRCLLLYYSYIDYMTYVLKRESYIYIHTQFSTNPGSNIPKKQQLNGHLASILPAIQVRQTRSTGPSWGSKEELLIDIFNGQLNMDTPVLADQQRHIHQPYANAGCHLRDLQEATDNRDGCQEKLKGLRAISMTWWWWWYILLNSFIALIKNISTFCWIK